MKKQCLKNLSVVILIVFGMFETLVASAQISNKDFLSQMRGNYNYHTKRSKSVHRNVLGESRHTP